eukprot:GHVS01093713.1.p1 GENE.GHVS01093713.1~~GHVS01093713.1.p1  ORF type:complete len:286 (+),score=46.02 GHVS01093713.1:119-976(+)
MKEMTFAWAMLQPNFLIKGCNSISKLDLASVILCKPLRKALGNRIPYLTGRNCQAIKSITVLELFTDDMAVAFLLQCFACQSHFRTYNRHLVVIELYLRLLKPHVYDQLADHVKLFLEQCRKASQQPMAVSDDSEETDGDESEGDETGHNFLSDVCCSLKCLGVKHYNRMHACPFLLDIYYPHAKIAIELNSSYQFYAGTQHFTATCKWRHRLLSAMGFHLIHLREEIWNRLDTAEQKLEFLRQSLPPILLSCSTQQEEQNMSEPIHHHQRRHHLNSNSDHISGL